MTLARSSRLESVLPSEGVTIECSSAAAGQDPPRAIDHYEGTAWIGGGEATPSIRVNLEKPQRAGGIFFTQAASSTESLRSIAGIERIRLTVDGIASEHDVDPGRPEPFVIPFEKRKRVSSFSIQILKPETGRRGIAELGLLDT